MTAEREPMREALERAWREGFQAARDCLTEDEAFTLTVDVEEDCWRDSGTRSALAPPTAQSGDRT
jgi:hypothetical protein